MTTLWDNDLIQFARLLDEIRATQENLDYDSLCESMDLEPDDIDELFERAMKVFERAKAELKFQQDGIFHEPIPDDFPVRPVNTDDLQPGIAHRYNGEGCGKCGGPVCVMPRDPVTCGHCHLTWDDAIPTQWTPAPSARCPFEYFHLYPEEP